MSEITGLQLIGEERYRQYHEEGRSDAHDDEHDEGELAEAALCYLSQALNQSSVYNEKPATLLDDNISTFWPWDDFKIKDADTIRQLSKAGALIAAEIDRRLREEHKLNKKPE
jgi:hypothetical protein